MKLKSDLTLYVVGAIAVIGITVSSYLFVQGQNKDVEIETLLQERNAVLKEMNNKNSELQVANTAVLELQKELDDLHEDLEDLADDYKDEKNRNQDFEDQLRALSGTLGDLDKLAKTDKELLAKYSKVYFLNENYIPTKLKEIPSKYILEGKKDQYFHTDALIHLRNMLESALKEGLDIKIVSAYRSFDEQTDLKGQFTQVYGSGANTFSADQGYSEHQLGTTVDLTTAEVGGTFASFANTEAFNWLQENAHRFGFILSYPEGNGFYIYEPWHWRFVSTDLARDLKRNSESFYDMDQRELDKYLLNFFD